MGEVQKKRNPENRIILRHVSLIRRCINEGKVLSTIPGNRQMTRGNPTTFQKRMDNEIKKELNVHFNG
jgi:hypothetical protein